jgi:nucleoside-diphosphate-sugar epimerase
MNVLVVGGAGFIGRWVVKQLLNQGNNVTVLDNLSNGKIENIHEFIDENCLNAMHLNKEDLKYINCEEFKFIKGDLRDEEVLDRVFKYKFDAIIHCAWSLNEDIYINYSKATFSNDIMGVFNIMERAKTQMFGINSKFDGEKIIVDSQEDTHNCKVIFLSTALVYKNPSFKAQRKGIDEEYAVEAKHFYEGNKLAAENIIMSYYKTYKLPVTIIRLFDTFGPFQDSDREGDIVIEYIQKVLNGENISMYGTGKMGRDLIYVKDCASFITKVAYSKETNGEILNAGTGKAVSLSELAKIISNNRVKIKRINKNSEEDDTIFKCNLDKSKKLLNWKPKYTLEKALKETESWVKLVLIVKNMTVDVRDT